MTKSLFIDYMEKMFSYPLWIKQTIFLNLSNDLTKYLSNEFLDVKEGDLFHIYRPVLSEHGQNELFTKESGYDELIYTFLNCCTKNMSLIEIAIDNNLTMEEVAKAFMFCRTSKFFSNAPAARTRPSPRDGRQRRDGEGSHSPQRYGTCRYNRQDRPASRKGSCLDAP